MKLILSSISALHLQLVHTLFFISILRSLHYLRSWLRFIQPCVQFCPQELLVYSLNYSIGSLFNIIPHSIHENTIKNFASSSYQSLTVIHSTSSATLRIDRFSHQFIPSTSLILSNQWSRLVILLCAPIHH